MGTINTRTVAATLAMTLLMTGLVVGLACQETDHQVAAAARAGQAREALALLDELNTGLGAAYAQRCAYILQSNPAAAQKCRSVAVGIRDQLRQLRELHLAEASERARLDDMAGLAEQKLALLEQSLRLREAARLNDRKQLVLTRQIQELDANLHRALASLRVEEDRDLAAQTRETQSSARKAGTVVGVGNLLNLAFLGLLAVALKRGLVANERSQVVARQAQEKVTEQSSQLSAAQRALEELASLRGHMEDQLRQAQQLASVGRVTSGVAHDFNNLLTLILGCSEASLRTLPEDDPSRPFIKQVLEAGRRAATLTRQLLSAGRPGSPCRLDLNAFVKEGEPLLRRLAGSNVNVIVNLAPRLGPVWADQGRLEQVLMNLVVNGRDAMPGEGKLTLETKPHTEDGSTPGKYAVLAVTDTGCGMDSATRARLFEPFFTTKEPGKGTGLGMAIVEDVVRQCGGRVEVDSEPGRGTSVRVYLPLASAEHTDDAPTEECCRQASC